VRKVVENLSGEKDQGRDMLSLQCLWGHVGERSNKKLRDTAMGTVVVGSLDTSRK
jgi:hypothetical protein